MLLDRALSLISPHICKGCGLVGSILCRRCFFNIKSDFYNKCLICGASVEQNNICSSCSIKSLAINNGVKNIHISLNIQQINNNGLFNQLFAVGSRQGALKKLVGDYKYNSEVAAVKPLALLLADRLKNLPAETVIIPIPTIPRHIRQRGFDHMKLLTKQLHRETGLTICNNMLKRTNNMVQHSQSADSRKKIIKSFVLSNRSQIDFDTPIILIDDIWTTGATLCSVAELFHESGYRNISGAVIARQDMDTTNPLETI